MPAKTKTPPARKPAKPAAARMTLAEAMSALEKAGSAQTRKTYARHGATEPMFGVSFATLKTLVKRIDVDHELALRPVGHRQLRRAQPRGEDRRSGADDARATSTAGRRRRACGCARPTSRTSPPRGRTRTRRADRVAGRARRGAALRRVVARRSPWRCATRHARRVVRGASRQHREVDPRRRRTPSARR